MNRDIRGYGLYIGLFIEGWNLLYFVSILKKCDRKRKGNLRLVHLVEDVPDLHEGHTTLYQYTRHPAMRDCVFVSQCESDKKSCNES